MKKLQTRLTYSGAFLMAIAVALGAFGSHQLKTHLNETDLEIFRTASHYHFIHAIGLLLLPGFVRRVNLKAIKWAGILFIGGIALFSFSLYLLSVSSYMFGNRLTEAGIITPFGGLAFMAGWIILGIGAFMGKNKQKYPSESEDI